MSYFALFKWVYAKTQTLKITNIVALLRICWYNLAVNWKVQTVYVKLTPEFYVTEAPLSLFRRHLSSTSSLVRVCRHTLYPPLLGAMGTPIYLRQSKDVHTRLPSVNFQATSLKVSWTHVTILLVRETWELSSNDLKWIH